MTLQIPRLAYGAVLIAVLFLPFGVYNTMAKPYVSGAVWGFMLPVGYVAAASGVAVIFYPRSNLLRRLGFGYLLILVGVSLLLSLGLYPRELSISLLHGTNAIDIDYSTFTGAVFWLSLLSVVAGIATKLTRIKPQLFSFFGIKFYSHSFYLCLSLIDKQTQTDRDRHTNAD